MNRREGHGEGSPEPIDWPAVERTVQEEVTRHLATGQVEDLTQEIMVDLVSRLPKVAPRLTHLLAWVRVVAERRCRREHRSRTHRKIALSLDALLEGGGQVEQDRDPAPAAPGEGPSSRLTGTSEQAFRRRLLELYRVLDWREQRVLRLVLRRGLSNKQCARTLKITPLQVRRSLRKLLKRAESLFGQGSADS